MSSVEPLGGSGPLAALTGRPPPAFPRIWRQVNKAPHPDPLPGVAGRGRAGLSERRSAARRGLLGLVSLVALLGAATASAQERWDHRGSLGLTVAGGAEVRQSVALSLPSDNGVRADAEVGGTVSITDHTELRVAGRLTLGAPALAGAVLAGVRNAFGERLKTFFDVNLMVHVAPWFTVGPHVAFGVQYEMLPVMGLYAALGIGLGFGAGLRLVGELMLGVQFRSYLLE